MFLTSNFVQLLMESDLQKAVRDVLLNNPSIVEEVILKHPEIIYNALTKISPWKDLATKDDINSLKKELENIRSDMVIKKDIEEVRAEMATKKELEEIRKTMATKKELESLQNMIMGLGSRWGILSEDTFRNGVAKILMESGYKVEKKVLFDKDGKVYG